MEQRAKQLICNIESTFYDLVQSAAAADNQSASKYVRGILISHLREKGLLDEATLNRVIL